PGRIAGLLRLERCLQEHQGGLVDAQGLLVALVLGGPLRPDELSRLLVPEVLPDGADRRLAEEVRPDDQGAVPVGVGLRQPVRREAPIGSHVFEAQYGLAVDLHPGAPVAQVTALAPPREQAIGRVGEEERGQFAVERAAIGLLLPRVAGDAGHSRTRTSYRRILSSFFRLSSFAA